jgi:hypothetical protein
MEVGSERGTYLETVDVLDDVLELLVDEAVCLYGGEAVELFRRELDGIEASTSAYVRTSFSISILAT